MIVQWECGDGSKKYERADRIEITTEGVYTYLVARDASGLAVHQLSIYRKGWVRVLSEAGTIVDELELSRSWFRGVKQAVADDCA